MHTALVLRSPVRFVFRAILRIARCYPVLSLGTALLSVSFLGAQTEAGPSISFTRQVRPILATNCFPCHGPDENTREADLRLDTAEGSTSDLGGYQAIVPGEPEESEVLKRMIESDPDLKMPPPESHKTLKPEQIELIKRWISQGARYESHWAFTSPVRPAVPDLTGELANWSAHPVDRFIAERWSGAGLKPAPAAKPEVLVRRLYLDLIGLPPTSDEARDWTKRLATSPLGPAGFNEPVYEALVDHLLASDHYGEHWARRWLDLARYADTNGYEKDRPRDIWPYRDWVIKAFNQDMRFDRFTSSQLAGDLLLNRQVEDQVATGFHRNTMLNEEGGIDPLEYRYYALTDRVATTGTTWLGLTLGCAQCHTHKYDPILHSEYFQLLAVFNNTEEPDLEMPSPDQLIAQATREEGAKQLLRNLAEDWPVEPGPDLAQRRASAIDAAFGSWLDQQRSRYPGWESIRPAAASAQRLHFEIGEDHSIFVVGDITKDDTYTLRFSQLPAGTRALRLEVLPDERLPGSGPGLTYFEGPKGDFFLGEFKLSAVRGEQQYPLSFSRADQSYANNHFGGQNVSAQLTLDGDPQTGWSCAGRFGERHSAVFELETPLAEPTECVLTMQFGRHYPCSLGKFRISVSSAASPVAAQVWPESIEALLQKSTAELNSSERDTLRREFLLQAPELKAQSDRIRELQHKPDYQKTLVLRERPASFPRPTFRHHRGEYLSPREEVQPGVPAFLPPLTNGGERLSRRGFAEWLLNTNHPLTYRVLVNRQWSALFGQGLVTTEGDFGLQGEPPSHPELLDWLALEFVDRGQSIKSLHRFLVTSRTYQLDSAVSAEHLKLDPGNRWLARANRKRLTAEQIRDSVLTASGLLNRQMYGPPVFPPQPDGATETAYGGANWSPSPPPARYRRGIYTFIKRTAPYAMFTTFDAPSGEVCLAQREASNTPLQSLTLLNDPVVTEAAQHFGNRLRQHSGSDDEKLSHLYWRVLAREPRPDEVAAIATFLAEQRRRLTVGELDAQLLTNQLPSPLPKESGQGGDLSAEDEQAIRREIAAWSMTARVILNLDEAIIRN